jgi:hypothetical protein
MNEIKDGLRPTVLDPGTRAHAARTWGTPTALWGKDSIFDGCCSVLCSSSYGTLDYPAVSGFDGSSYHFKEQAVLERVGVHTDVIAVQHLSVQDLDG